MILGGLALKLGEAGVEAGVLRQDRGDQESNLQAEQLVNPNHRGRGHIRPVAKQSPKIFLRYLLTHSLKILSLRHHRKK